MELKIVTEFKRKLKEDVAGELTIAVSNLNLVADRLETSTTSLFAIVNAFPIINVSVHALPAEIRTVNKIVMYQMISALATFEKLINNLLMIIVI